MTAPAPASRAAAAHADGFGRPAAGVWVAPGRVNLVGEHTDYSDGFVLPFAVEQHLAVAASPRADGRLRLVSLELGAATVEAADVAPGRVRGWAAYPAGAVWALRRVGVAVPGLDLVVASDLPAGGGLSSSAALVSAVLLAAGELAAGELGEGGTAPAPAPDDPVALARLAQQAEHELAGVPCGLMDPMAVLACRPGHAMALDTRSLARRHVAFAPERAGLATVVVDTGAHRALAAGAYAERRAACEEAARRLGVPALRDAGVEQVDAAAAELGPVLHRRARHVVTENARVLAAVSVLERGDWDGLAGLMAASHRSLRDDFEVSAPALDAVVDAAGAVGAPGARLTGAGFGGCALVLCPEGALGALVDELDGRFAAQGWPRPRPTVVRAGGAARRVA